MKRITVIVVLLLFISFTFVHAAPSPCTIPGCPGYLMNYCTNVFIAHSAFEEYPYDEECKVFYDIRWTGTKCDYCDYVYSSQTFPHDHTEFHDICVPDTRNVCGY